jgi:hypothetical protein
LMTQSIMLWANSSPHWNQQSFGVETITTWPEYAQARRICTAETGHRVLWKYESMLTANRGKNLYVTQQDFNVPAEDFNWRGIASAARDFPKMPSRSFASPLHGVALSATTYRRRKKYLCGWTELHNVKQGTNVYCLAKLALHEYGTSSLDDDCRLTKQVCARFLVFRHTSKSGTCSGIRKFGTRSRNSEW